MPSPFPGMDPYLEDPAIFPDLHDSMIAYARELLNAQLPPPYYAGSASRVWVELTQRRVGPDVSVLRPAQGPNGGGRDEGGGVAVAEAVVTEPVLIRLSREEVRETFLEIYAQPGGDRLVTTIEILSLANKSHSSHGRTPYLQKQKEVLNSKVHLVEIDLLRGGIHSTAVPLEHAVARTGPFDYHACVHTYDAPDDYRVYPILLGHRLPILAVPLLPGDAPARLDLQALLDRCYDTGQYRRRVRYRAETVPPLRSDQAEWARQLLRAQGLLGPEPEMVPPGQGGVAKDPGGSP